MLQYGATGWKKTKGAVIVVVRDPVAVAGDSEADLLHVAVRRKNALDDIAVPVDPPA